jgi:hypothetical protein
MQVSPGSLVPQPVNDPASITVLDRPPKPLIRAATVFPDFLGVVGHHFLAIRQWLVPLEEAVFADATSPVTSFTPVPW